MTEQYINTNDGSARRKPPRRVHEEIYDQTAAMSATGAFSSMAVGWSCLREVWSIATVSKRGRLLRGRRLREISTNSGITTISLI